MDVQTKINANNNIARRSLYQGNDHKGPKERLLKFIPVARYMIKHYINAYWKNDVNHSEYVFKEYQICTTIETSGKSKAARDFDLRMSAAILDTKTLVLLNDKELLALMDQVNSG